MMPTDALSELRKLIAEWRFSAFQSREEAGRIRRTVNIATPAESNCIIRAELWDQCADSLEALLPALEQQRTPKIHVDALEQRERELRETLQFMCDLVNETGERSRDRLRAALNPEVTR